MSRQSTSCVTTWICFASTGSVSMVFWWDPSDGGKVYQGTTTSAYAILCIAR